MNENTWPNRFYGLDISRGFASMSVVLWHWQHFAFVGTSLSRDFMRESLPLYDILRLFYEKGRLGVDYFFLLSGFIFFWRYRESIRNKMTSVRTFFVKRFSRLYPLHLATLLIVALLQMLYISRENTSFVFPFNDTYHFFLNLGLISIWGLESGWSFNAPVWAVSVEVLLYISFFIIAFLGQGGVLFSLSISALSLALFSVSGNVIFNGFALFYLGGVVYQFASAISTEYRFLKSPVYLIAIAGWICVLINFYIFDLKAEILKYGTVGDLFLKGDSYILIAVTVCALVLLDIDKGPILKPISWVGDITYSVYLLHFPLQLIFGLAVSYGFLDFGFYLAPIYLGYYFVILLPLSYIVYKEFERPVQYIIRNKLLHNVKILEEVR